MPAPATSPRLTRLREALARTVARPFFALLLVLGRILPQGALLRVAGGASRLVYWLFPGVRRGLLENAAHILGPDSSPGERARLARGVLRSFSRFLVELVAPPGKGPEQDLLAGATGREHFEAAAARKKGVIAVTLHMGNYELSSAAIARLRGDAAIVYNRDPMAFIERARSARRRVAGLDEIVIDASRFFAIDVLERLRSGGLILLSGDQVEARDGRPFPFLHGVAPFSLWPARLAIASGAPLLPAFNVLAEDGRYRLRLEPPIVPEAGCSPESLTAELVQVFARQVERHPEQWLMIRRFWLDEDTKP